MSIPRNLSIIADTLNADGTFFTITDTGNLTFTGTGNRITGDFTNATVANRVMFQTSTVNANTVIGAIPNGTATAGVIQLYANSDPTNTSVFQLTSSGGAGQISLISGISGTGTYLPMTFSTGGGERMRLDTSGNVGIGTSSGTARLNVNGGTSTSQIRWEVNNAAFTNEVSTNAAANAYVYKSNDASYHVWKLSSSTAMTLDTSGNLGIGVSGPGAKLDVNGVIRSTGTGAILTFSKRSTGIGDAWGMYSQSGEYNIYDYTAGLSRLVIDTSGTVLVGITSATASSLIQLSNGIASTAGASNKISLYYASAASAFGFGIASGQLTYNSGDGAHVFYNGGNTSPIERMRIDSAGNVGIGNSSPGGFRLNVTGSMYQSDGYATLGGYNAGTTGTSPVAGGISFSTNITNGQAESNVWNGNDPASYANTGILFTQRLTSSTRRDLMFLHNSGNVGIGTNSPTARLNVVNSANSGTATDNCSIVVSATNRTGFIQLDSNVANGNSSVIFSAGGTEQGRILYKADSNYMYFSTATTERMRIDSSGNVLVGTTSTLGAKFALYGTASGSNNYIQITNPGQGTACIGLTASGSNVKLYNCYATGVLADGVGIDINTSGSVGIGQTSPQAKLQINTAADGAQIIVVGAQTGNEQTLLFRNSYYTNNTTSGIAAIGWIDSGSSGGSLTFKTGTNGGGVTNIPTERMRIDNTGNLLVGGTTTGGRVTSISSTNDLFYGYNAAQKFAVTNGGTIFAVNTTISAISDIRYKENVRDIDVGLDKIMALKPRLYDWKEGKGADIKNARGFIAQEFEQVFPDLVDEWKDPVPEGEEPYKSVRQDLIPVLVKAIQEQQTLITSLTARIEALESR